MQDDDSSLMQNDRGAYTALDAFRNGKSKSSIVSDNNISDHHPSQCPAAEDKNNHRSTANLDRNKSDNDYFIGESIKGEGF